MQAALFKLSANTTCGEEGKRQIPCFTGTCCEDKEKCNHLPDTILEYYLAPVPLHSDRLCMIAVQDAKSSGVNTI